MLLASLALLPLNVSADTGFHALLFVTPEGQVEGDTVDLNLETFLDGVPTDADTISIGADPLYDDIPFTKTATGKYHASYDITATDQANHLATIAGTAELGTESSFVRSFYEVFQEPGLDTTLRVVSGPAAGGASLGPGESAVVEARSYLDGLLTEVEPVTFIADWYSDGTSGNDPLDAVKVGDGVYQTTVDVPTDLRKTREYFVEAKFTTITTKTIAIQTDPYEVWTVTSDTPPDPVDTMAYVMDLYLGGDDPIEGATVEVTGQHFSYLPYGVTELGPYTATTDAEGHAEVYVEEGLDPASTWILKAIAENHEVTRDLGHGPLGGNGWSPREPNPAGCDAMLETDPTQYHPGETAHLTYQTFYAATPSDNREALPSVYAARYVWREGDAGTAVAGEAQTDADGRMVIDYDIPNDWSPDDTLNVQVVCPSGDVSRETVHFSGPDPFGATDLTVTASGNVGGKVPITAKYTGTGDPDGAVAVAVIVPANFTAGASGALPGHLATQLNRSGDTFTGQVDVPSWLPPGAYVVTVRMSSEGATADRSSEFSTAASLALALGAAPTGSNEEPPTGGNETGGGGNETGGGGNETGGGGNETGGEESGSFIPGVPAGMALGAAAVAALVAARWRREEE